MLMLTVFDIKLNALFLDDWVNKGFNFEYLHKIHTFFEENMTAKLKLEHSSIVHL